MLCWSMNHLGHLLLRSKTHMPCLGMWHSTYVTTEFPLLSYYIHVNCTIAYRCCLRYSLCHCMFIAKPSMLSTCLPFHLTVMQTYLSIAFSYVGFCCLWYFLYIYNVCIYAQICIWTFSHRYKVGHLPFSFSMSVAFGTRINRNHNFAFNKILLLLLC